MRATRTHLLVGQFDAVAAVMATARERGRLVRVHCARELPGGWVEVMAEIRDPQQAAAAPQSGGRWRPWLVAGGWLLGLVVVAGVVWLAVLAVLALIAAISAAVAWVGAHLAAIVAIGGALLLVALLCAGRSSCTGMHCGGCRR
jgi:hypothetical protein